MEKRQSPAYHSFENYWENSEKQTLSDARHARSVARSEDEDDANSGCR
jgi:hypothetical protein